MNVSSKLVRSGVSVIGTDIELHRSEIDEEVFSSPAVTYIEEIQTDVFRVRHPNFLFVVDPDMAALSSIVISAGYAVEKVFDLFTSLLVPRVAIQYNVILGALRANGFSEGFIYNHGHSVETLVRAVLSRLDRRLRITS